MGRLQGQTQFRSLTELTPQIDISDLRTLPARIVHARWALADIEAFKARFPPLNSELTPFPTFSWEALIRQLEHLMRQSAGPRSGAGQAGAHLPPGQVSPPGNGVAGRTPARLGPDGRSQGRGGRHELSPLAKLSWIAVIALGALGVMSATLPGLLLLQHALQSAHTHAPLRLQ